MWERSDQLSHRFDQAERHALCDHLDALNFNLWKKLRIESAAIAVANCDSKGA